MNYDLEERTAKFGEAAIDFAKTLEKKRNQYATCQPDYKVIYQYRCQLLRSQ